MRYVIDAFFLAFCLTLISCSSTEEPAQERAYSEDTNKAFLEIERGGSYYLKKPQPSTVPPQVMMPPAKTSKEARIGPRAVAKKEDGLQVSQIKSNGNNQERLIEINQNLAFYCMKNRKSSVFGGDEKKCMNFVNTSLKKCQKLHKNINSKLLACLNGQLKRGP